MRTLLLFLAVLSLASPLFALGDKSASAWMVSNVSVSSTTAAAIPTTSLSRRYKMIVQNTSSAFDLYIGTSTALTATASFVVLKSSASVEMPIPEGLTVYGLAQAGAVAVDVRVIEYR